MHTSHSRTFAPAPEAPCSPSEALLFSPASVAGMARLSPMQRLWQIPQQLLLNGIGLSFCGVVLSAPATSSDGSDNVTLPVKVVAALAGLAIAVHAVWYARRQWRRALPEDAVDVQVDGHPEGVDLNRNFHDFSKPLPSNAGYDELAHALVPATWPPPLEAQARLQAYAAAHGERGLQAAVSGGQYTHPQGLFFGGLNPTWSNVTLRHVLQAHGQRCERLGWIDLHTGLGPSGHGEFIFACRDDARALARARAWWGESVTSIYDGSSSSALLTGLMWLAAEQECGQAEYTGIALEYGTEPVAEVIEALRGDHWLENHPEADAAQATAIKRRIRDAFYTDTDAWKRRIVEQGVTAARQAVTGLAA